VNRDITYCVSSKCPKADTCDRWWMNNFVGMEWVGSMSDFYTKGKVCRDYVERKEDKEAVCSKADRKVVKRKGAKLWKQRKKSTA
jgi:hypothetical protein